MLSPFWQDLIAIAGLALGIIGFWVAIVQIRDSKEQARQAKTAAEAARDAAERAATGISSNFLLVLLPQLHRVESDLDNAVEQKDRRLVAYQMSQWRWQAGQLRGLLSTDTALGKRLGKSIQTSIALAATAKIDALDVGSDLAAVARPVQEAVAVVTGDVGQLSSAQTTKGN